MAKITHITAQEEGVTETGIQIRDTEPSSPVEGQMWVLLLNKALKVRTGGETIVLYKGRGLSHTLSGTVIDANICDAFYKNIAADITLTINNLLEGESIKVLLNNVNEESVFLDFIGEFLFDHSETGEISGSSAKLFTIYKLNDLLLVNGVEYSF